MDKKSLGRSLYRAKVNSTYVRRENGTDEIFLNQAAEVLNQGSITDRNDLEEFLATAELADSEFTAERVTTTDLAGSINASKVVSKAELDTIIKKNSHIIRVPRRPDWRKMNSAMDLKKAENLAFLDWRKQLATIENQDNFILTPFERNIEMWRQLWRVVEVSDLLVQIVDARNPMLFYCEDLVTYAKEVKPNMKFLLLVNKADLLVPEQKEQWKIFFDSRNIDFCFFSASYEILDDTKSKNHSKDISRSELLDMFENMFPQGGHVGFVGYPNVGKSSTINALVGEKRVSVAATPGKTKHFQTINLSKGIILCDCPGLVFPNISSSRAELVLNGILPIDQLRDFIRPTSLLCQYVPKAVLESIYGITLISADFEDKSDHVDYSTFLSAYAVARGFRTSNFGNPDESRAARIVLKDFAKILFCYPPPNVSDSDFNTFNFENTIKAYINRPKPKIQPEASMDPFLDDESQVQVFVKQPNGRSNYACLNSKSGPSAEGKSSKKHYKMNKKNKSYMTEFRVSMISSKGAIGITAAVGSWVAAYYFIAEEIDKSSSIVNQSLYNINISDKAENEVSLPVKISSGVKGKMNQFKGHAQISFDVLDRNNNKFIAEVNAKRRGLNWKTDKLMLRSVEGKEIIFI